jgi:hypothetical protein
MRSQNQLTPVASDLWSWREIGIFIMPKDTGVLSWHFSVFKGLCHVNDINFLQWIYYAPYDWTAHFRGGVERQRFPGR